jgi:hypothetical protein
MDKPMTQVEMLRWLAGFYTGTQIAEDFKEAADTIELQQRDIIQLQGELKALRKEYEMEAPKFQAGER